METYNYMCMSWCSNYIYVQTILVILSSVQSTRVHFTDVIKVIFCLILLFPWRLANILALMVIKIKTMGQ